MDTKREVEVKIYPCYSYEIKNGRVWSFYEKRCSFDISCFPVDEDIDILLAEEIVDRRITARELRFLVKKVYEEGLQLWNSLDKLHDACR